MRGIKLLTLIKLLAGIFFFGFLYQFPSWSSSDGSELEPFLKLGLSCISLSLYAISFTHKEAGKLIFKSVFYKDVYVRLRHLDRFTAFMFVGVLAFGVNEIKFLHFLFIILASIGMFIRVVRYYKKGIYRIIGLVAMLLASGSWVIAFIFPDILRVGDGELIFYVVCAASIISQIKKLE